MKLLLQLQQGHGCLVGVRRLAFAADRRWRGILSAETVRASPKQQQRTRESYASQRSQVIPDEPRPAGHSDHDTGIA